MILFLAFWQLMALLLLRHALSITDDGDGEGDDDASTFFSVSIFAKLICIYLTITIFRIKVILNSSLMQLFLLRAVGFLLPCYIMIWAISILQRRRQRQASASKPNKKEPRNSRSDPLSYLFMKFFNFSGTGGCGSGSSSVCYCRASGTKQRSPCRLSCTRNRFTGDSSPRTRLNFMLGGLLLGMFV